MTKFRTLSAVSLLAIASLAATARADSSDFSFTGPGVSGQGTITYTPNPDGSAKITGITGLFSDTNPGINGKPLITNATITGLVAINPVSPLPAEVLAPDFSYFPIVNGVPTPPPQPSSPALSFDNTYYPNGSPVVCLDYPASGGALDVYGLAFTLSTGHTVDLWSNGSFPGAPTDPAPYGLAVADPTFTYDYVASGVTLSIPEPASLTLLPLAAAATLPRRRKALPTA